MIPHKLYINGNVMKKKLELLIFSNLYLNLNVNQSEKIMQRPFVCLEGSIKLLDLIFC